MHSNADGCITRKDAYVVTDVKRGTEPWFVLTGDTLSSAPLVARIGLAVRVRTLRSSIYASIPEKLLTLPDEIEMYPGHFSGSVCGAGLSGKPMSTIAFDGGGIRCCPETSRRSSRPSQMSHQSQPAWSRF
jgi:hypothetical protein